jgi:CBS domain-containing protein
MLVNDYISKDFIPPKLNQTVQHGLELIQEFGLTHVPVFEGLNFIGNISRENLEKPDPNLKLIEIKDFTEFFYITENSSLLDAVQKFHNFGTNILPVINEEKQYLGLLMMDDVISGLSTMPFILEPGAILVIEVPQKQFSISEIAKIAESNNARIIGLFVTGYSDDKVQIALKLISENLASVGETFERFGYTVVFKFFNDEKEDLYKDRFEQLMKYLDI